MSTTAKRDKAYIELIKDPEMNAKVHDVLKTFREKGYAPAHLIFAVALCYKGSEQTCDCGNPDIHRINAIDEVTHLFIDAYDAAEVVKAKA